MQLENWDQFLAELKKMAPRNVSEAQFNSAIRRRLLVFGKRNHPESTSIEWRRRLAELVEINKLDWETGLELP